MKKGFPADIMQVEKLGDGKVILVWMEGRQGKRFPGE